MSFCSRDVFDGYFELTKQIPQLKQIIFKISKKLKLHISSSETEIDQQTSSIEYHEERIKVFEELKIEEKLKSIFDNLNIQLSSIDNLSNELNSQDCLPKNPHGIQIQTYLPNIPNYLNIYSIAYPETSDASRLFQYYNM
jgi:hypothetical protein